MAGLIRTVGDLGGKHAGGFAPREEPSGLLLCPPDHFDVIDVKNPHMKGQVGRVDRRLARDQWEMFRRALVAAGRKVHLLPPTPGLEDMVFTANPVFVDSAADGKTCLLSNMRFPSRRKEVPGHERWFSEHGYRIVRLSNPAWNFEGHGDALWHPHRRLIWGGYGFRSVPEVYAEMSDLFSAPVVLLELKNEAFYHLDTCLCPLSEDEALYFPGAFDAAGLELITALFPRAIEVSEKEARHGFACNALPVGQKVLIQKGNTETVRILEKRGYQPVELETSEFIKSGGSVSCMKMTVF